jgi:hypothetical protein
MSFTVACGCTFTRYADGSVHIVHADMGDMPMSQDETAELGNYLMATATALPHAQDLIDAAAIDAQQQAAIDAARKTTEVIP